MKPTALINDLLRIAPTWSRIDLLKEINTVQSMILSIVQPSMRIIDVGTGKDPVLTTTSGVFVYELTAAGAFGYDVLRIENVRSLDGEELLRTYNGYDRYGSVEVINSQKASGGSKAKVIFNFDPGGAEYYIGCYSAPAELVSENIHISLPDEYVFTHLFNGVAGRIEEFEHGVGQSHAWEKFTMKTLPQLRYDLDKEVNSHIVRINEGDYNNE